MAKDLDPTKDPEFQKAVQALLKAPPQPRKKGAAKPRKKRPRADDKKTD
jgi:hypothetical protein